MRFNAISPRALPRRSSPSAERSRASENKSRLCSAIWRGLPPWSRRSALKRPTRLDRVYEILIHQVHDFEGTVNELTGDGIMALFGAPIALEDAPQRALRFALAGDAGVVEGRNIAADTTVCLGGRNIENVTVS